MTARHTVADRAVIDLTPQGFRIHALSEHVTLAQPQAWTDALLLADATLQVIRVDADGVPHHTVCTSVA